MNLPFNSSRWRSKSTPIKYYVPAIDWNVIICHYYFMLYMFLIVKVMTYTLFLWCLLADPGAYTYNCMWLFVSSQHVDIMYDCPWTIISLNTNSVINFRNLHFPLIHLQYIQILEKSNYTLKKYTHNLHVCLQIQLLYLSAVLICSVTGTLS